MALFPKEEAHNWNNAGSSPVRSTNFILDFFRESANILI